MGVIKNIKKVCLTPYNSRKLCDRYAFQQQVKNWEMSQIGRERAGEMMSKPEDKEPRITRQ